MYIKKVFYYVYYVYYRSNEKSNHSIFPGDFVAGVMIQILEMGILFSAKLYYSIIFDVHTMHKYEVVVSVLALSSFNYMTFIHYTEWKKYFKKFDKCSEHDNFVSRWMVRAMAVLVILSIIVALTISRKQNSVNL